MGGLRRAKIRQAKRAAESKNDAEKLKMRIAALKITTEAAVRVIGKLQELYNKVRHNLDVLQYEFDMLPEDNKDTMAKKVLEAVNISMNSLGTISHRISKQLDSLEEMRQELDRLTGADESHLRLTERQAAAMGFS